MMFFSGTVLSQENRQQSQDTTLNINNPQVLLDSIPTAPNVPSDSVNNPEQSSDLKTKIDYDAKDSIISDVINQRVFLYRDAIITYGDIKLEAYYIEIDFKTNTIIARPEIDSLGKPVSKPIFTQGADTYELDSMRYNFESDKAIISGVLTQQGEGFLSGDKIKKNQYDELFINEGRFCPCEDPEAGTYIKSNRIKVIPKKKIVTGPFQLYIGDVPTPLFLPFGMFPAPREKHSGIVFPTYGEERRRGFFLKNGGYYFAISEYIDLELLGSIYSKGGYELQSSTSYKKRYKFNGRFNLRYNKLKSGEAEDSLFTKDFWVNWSHSPESRGTGRFSASVNAGTSTFNQNVAQSVERNIRTQFSSNVSYSKTFRGTPFSMGISARHNQNVATKVVNITLPQFSLNMGRVNPFKRKGSSGNTWYEKINFSYRFSATNQISNNRVSSSGSGFTVANPNPLNDSIVPFSLENVDILLDRARIGGKHDIPISTSFNLFKHFTISPSINYSELWYLKKLDYRFIPEENAVRVDTVDGFTRASTYSLNASLSTSIYGTFQLKGERLQAIRHTIRPSIGFSYRPDFSQEKFGFYQEVQTDTTELEDGTFRTQLLSRYNGFVFGSPPLGESRSLNFSLSNNVEAKVLNRRDTTGKARKVSLLDNFSMSGSYNFVRDSFKLSNISLSARTRLFNKKLDISANGTLNPYTNRLISSTVNENGEKIIVQRRIDEIALFHGEGLGQITRASLRLSTNLNPQARKGDRKSDKGTAEELEFINANPDLYVDFTIPWSLRINYTWNYSKDGFKEKVVTQSMSFSGDFSLTDKWKITYNSGYDFDRKQLTQTRLGITRDLNCWTFRFDWTPFGRFQSFSLDIRVKSSILSDLKLSKRRSFNDLR
ncbi:putative LPS assembly protein LptD [Fulvivirgaceae bacterium BMA10]|uniref:LPS assembly protein LptD n=1 Tax=Splendidivirga corallicola TaxID=3051826 RepID=A0ABT8KS26_9BACT|nr:putative LPS assembly protein LptD [Fulvivirgaceae bacterium BMA10]